MTFIVGLFCSCKTEFSAQEYVTAVDSNEDLVQSSQINEVNYVFKPITSKYLRSIEVLKLAKYNDALDLSITQKKEINDLYKGVWFLKLRISHNSGENLNSDGATILEHLSLKNSYLESDVVKDIYLLDGYDTLRPLSVQNQKSYGISPDINLLFVFEKQEINASKLELEYVDEVTRNAPQVIHLELPVEYIKEEKISITELKK